MSNSTDDLIDYIKHLQRREHVSDEELQHRLEENSALTTVSYRYTILSVSKDVIGYPDIW